MAIIGLSGLSAGKVYSSYGGESKFWFGTATSIGGIATFYPTDDGSPSGNPLFLDILLVLPGAALDTTTPTAVPLTSVKAIAGDRKSVTINTVTGVVLIAAAATLQLAPDGTVVNCMVWGD